MKKDQIKIGSTYTAKVSGGVVPVRITDEVWSGDKHTGWKGVNTQTGRSVRIKSSQRLRGEVGAVGPAASGPEDQAEPPEATTPPETPVEVAVAGPDAGAATATKGKKAGKGAKAKDATAKATPPAKEPKAVKPAKEKNPPKPKRVSLLDSAATVLAEAKEPMSAKEIVADVLNRKMWSTKGETPEATLYAAMIREIAAKKGEARFKKVDRGLFVAAGK